MKFQQYNFGVYGVMRNVENGVMTFFLGGIERNFREKSEKKVQGHFFAIQIFLKILMKIIIKIIFRNFRVIFKIFLLSRN